MDTILSGRRRADAREAFGEKLNESLDECTTWAYNTRRGRRRRRGSEEIRREVLATFGHDAQDESGDELDHLFEEHDSKYWADDERCVQDTRSRRGALFLIYCALFLLSR